MDLRGGSQDQTSTSTSSSSEEPSSASSIPQRWAAAWSSPDSSAWLALYAAKATYIDHAFQIRRTGTSVLKRHFEIWRNSIPDFAMEVVECLEGGSDGKGESGSGTRRCSIRTVNRGTFVHDLPSKEASGRHFSFRGVVDFVIRQDEDGDGLIEEVNEYYSFNFDAVEGVEGFHALEDLGGS